MNIVEPIFAQCRNKPSELALCAPGTEFSLVSYARLERSVDNICRRLISAGVLPQNRIAVFVNDPIFHAMILIALTKLGAITISGRNRKLIWPFAVDAVIADAPNDLTGDKIIVAESGWTTDNDQGRQVPLHRAGPHDVCRIFLTFGADGAENGIAVTNRMMTTRIDRQKLFFGPQAPFCDRTFLDLPLATSLGFQVLLATLWRGGTLVMSGDTEKTIESLPIYAVQNVVGSAKTWRNVLAVIDKQRAYRPHLQAAFCIGSVPRTVSNRVRARICSNLTIGHLSWDATMVASMPAHFGFGTDGALGFVLPGVRVEIIDDRGQALPAGKQGSVRIKSEYGVHELLGDQQAAQRTFRRGWLHTGEVGYLTPDNMLVVAAQSPGPVNIDGEEVDIRRLEETLLMHANVVKCCVLPVQTKSGAGGLWAFIVPRSYFDVEALRTHCSAYLPSFAVPSDFIAVDDLPTNAQGNIDRAKLAEFIRSKSN